VTAFDGLRNLGAKAARRAGAMHKPLLRLARRRARAEEHRGYAREAAAVDRELAAIAAGTGPIVVGPWLAEVGYEVLYWIPFVRWFCDAHGVNPSRVTVISRGGMAPLYAGVAARYVDLFDLRTPQRIAAENAQRRASQEGGGQKQSDLSDLDRALVDDARVALRLSAVRVCHPSLMFRLFRHVWHDNLPFDVLWRHTRYERMTGPFAEALADLPSDFVTVKMYNGPALSTASLAAVQRLVRDVAARGPVVVLETDLAVDEHRDFDFSSIPGVVSARPLMTPQNNLAVQLELIARSRLFLSACGGLAWLAPFLGVPTIGVYDSDALLAPHLFVARQAGRRAGAAAFSPLDLNAIAELGLDRRPA